MFRPQAPQRCHALTMPFREKRLILINHELTVQHKTPLHRGNRVLSWRKSGAQFSWQYFRWGKLQHGPKDRSSRNCCRPR